MALLATPLPVQVFPMIGTTSFTDFPAAADPATITRGRPQPANTATQPEMRLADFILTHRDAILAEWAAFAKTCAPASGSMGITALSDHASEMLTVIAADLKTPQDRLEQSKKSKGQAPPSRSNELTAAEKHGTGRAESGFTLDQMVAEYRALRASVIRLWTKERTEASSTDLDDLTRFNEAIDQSLAESITRFTEDLDKSKEMFLAILGHDLRSPIGAVLTSAKFMLETNELEEPHRTLTTRIVSATTRMNQMVGALLDFTRSRLGGGIPIKRESMNMGKLVHDVVNEVLAAHPERRIHVNARGALKGEWDCERMTQVLTNLVGNAIEHGSQGTAVAVDVQGSDDEVTIAIHNRGVAIPEDQLDGLFSAMKRRSAVSASAGSSANLGLGLYIADRIVHAHKGTIQVESTEEKGTTFTVHLPRRES
jgi:signal transduction histidine kinase